MPKTGERQTVNGVTGEWNGSTWLRVPDTSEPGTFWGGFTKHLLEKEKTTVAALAGGALLAAPVIGGPAAAGIAAAGPALSEIGARGSQAVSGDPVEPVGLGTVLNAASCPARVYGPGMAARGVASGARAVASSPAAQKVLGMLGGGVAGGAAGELLHEPWLGAIIGSRAGAAAGPSVGRAAASVAPKAMAAADNLNLGKTFSEIPEMFGAEPKFSTLGGLKSAIPPAAGPPTNGGGLSATERAYLVKNHYPADTIAEMERRAGGSVNSQPIIPGTTSKPISTATPSMPNAPSQNPGELWPYQSDAVQAKIQALRDAVPSASTKPDLMDSFLKAQTAGPVKAGTPWYGDNGEIIGHTTDTNGSTGFAPLESPAAKIVSDINAGSSEGRMTMQGAAGPGGLDTLGGETPHLPPDPMTPYAGPQSPVALTGGAFEAEYGVPEPVGPEPTSSPIPDDMMARRLARLQQVFGGRQ